MANVKRKPPLSDEEAEDLADYVEGLELKDLSKGRPGPGFRGRPSLTDRAIHSPSIHVRLPAALYEELSRQAGAAGITVSHLVREILEKHS